MPGCGCSRCLAGALLAFALGACAAPQPGPDVPRFPPSSATAASSTAESKIGLVPDECPALLSTASLEAVLGLPLNSVAVRTTIGVPLPASGRTERIDCAFSGTMPPVQGRALLALAATGFSDRAAARKQWQINADASDGERRDLPVGAAEGVMFLRRGEAELSLVYGRSTLTLVLPDRPLPGGISREGMLTDLARRVLPTMADATGRPTLRSAPTDRQPARSVRALRTTGR